MTRQESKLLKEMTVETYPSGVIIIVFDFTKRFASVYRNANDVFTLTAMMDGVVTDQEVITIPELSGVGVGMEYYTSYSTEKEQCIIHCVPMKYYDEEPNT